MIPAGILTVLHYVSLTAAVLVTALIGWEFLRSKQTAESDLSSEKEGRGDEPAENG